MLIINHYYKQRRIICTDKLEITDPILGQELTSSLNELNITITELKPKVKKLFYPTSISIFRDGIYLQTSSLRIIVKLKNFLEVKTYIDNWIKTAYETNSRNRLKRKR